jgi:hemerythrin
MPLRRTVAFLTWENKYSVGVQALDQQHTTLFDIINELHTAMMQRKAQSVTAPLLRKLADYTRYHFAAEEALLMAKAYPGLAQHRLLHADLVKQVEDFVSRSERGDITLRVDLMNFLRNWLTDHILKVDSSYGSYLAAREAR